MANLTYFPANFLSAASFKRAFIALPIVVLAGCIDDDLHDYQYTANVTRTEYGIPHISADNWGSLGFGYGYTYAQDNFCVVMKEVVRANGDSALYLGEEGNLQQDFVYKLYNTDEYIRDTFLANDDFAEAVAGFTAGVNRYLKVTGVDNLAEGDEGCRGAAWVRELNSTDLGKMLRKLILRASTDPLAEYIAAQDGPDDAMVIQARQQRLKTAPLQAQKIQLVDNGLTGLLPKPEEFGSNAYAIGANNTVDGSGLLLGNPHFPWQGSNRFYMVHLTIPGVYDVMGASLHGFPAVNIGFNKDVAWTHTVSTGKRFTLYEIKLDPDNPMKYQYGDELRDITTQTVSAQRRRADGSIETVEHTFYLTHYGPVLDLSEPTGVDLLGDWPTPFGTVYAVRDVNLHNNRGFDYWVGMGMATSLEELLVSTRTIGNPWTNTIAVDRGGNAFYGDISTVPHVTQAQFDTCINGFIPPQLTDFGLVTLDGSDPACEWGSDISAPVDGVFGYDSLPKIETRDYAANANDSYWLSNPSQLLTGFSPIIGMEEIEQTLRTRLTFTQAEQRIAGTDGLPGVGFDVLNLQQVALGARNIAAELALDDILDICNSVSDWSSESLSAGYVAQNPGSMPEACNVLGSWDRRSDIDSVGPHVFQESWFALLDIVDDEELDLWAVAFDATAPVTTPNTLNTGDPAVVMAVKTALASGVDTLTSAGIPLDRPWGEVQYAPRNGDNIPIHGASGAFSFAVITASLIDGEGYSDIRHGNSYIQTIGWDGSECPDAYAILTYSQSTNPASPFYADMTRLYSNKEWVDMPFCEADIRAQQVGPSLYLQNW
jgi:acyl-homoserine-lactone acylase